jgi:hypothetical protein
MISRYQNIEIIKNNDGVRIYNQVYYPEIESQNDDYFIITSSQDRFDLIANDFWGNEKLWWVLPIINNLECDSMYPPVGFQLFIPKNIENFENECQKINSN